MMRFSIERVRSSSALAGKFLGEWLMFGLLAMAATWPLATSWTTHLPVGMEPVETVPLFNLWTLWWNIDRAGAGFQDYWDAPIFYPTPDAFAFSEPQPTMGLMAPVVWAGGTEAAAYNLYLLLGLSLTGVATSRLLRRYTGSRFAAWTGGAMMVMLPYVHWQLGVIQLVPLFGIVWTIHALALFGDSPSVLRSLALGTAFAVTYFLCNYYGLFLSLVLILTGAFLLGRNLWNWRTWPRLVPGAAWCLLLIGPMIYVQREVSKQHDWERPPELIERLSAEWGDFTATPTPQLLPIRQFVDPGRSGWTLAPGYLKMGLAVFGILCGVCDPTLRRLTLFLTLFTLLSLFLAMGPKFHLGDWTPYEWIRLYYPGMAMARNVYRFVVFSQMGIVLLAAISLNGLRQLLWSHREADVSPKMKLLASAAWWRQGLTASLLVVGILAVMEVWPDWQHLFELPSDEENQAWITWVRTHTPPDAALACVPFPKGGNAKAYFGTTVWMYYGMRHHRPLVNGYSGFFPERFLTLKLAMAAFPFVDSLNLLEASGTRYCIVFRGTIRRQEIEHDPQVAKRLKWRFSDNHAEIDIYELLPLAESKREKVEE